MSNVMVMDAESLGTKDSAVVLSYGMVITDPSVEKTFEEIYRDDTLYIKLSIKDQVSKGRTIDKSTLEWWKKQGAEASHVLSPSKDDVTVEAALSMIDNFMSQKNFNPKQSTSWSRGLIDHRWLEDMCKMVGRNSLVPFWMPREIRTQIDCLKGTKNGYIPEIREPLENSGVLIKHHAAHDTILDYLQLRDACLNPTFGG